MKIKTLKNNIYLLLIPILSLSSLTGCNNEEKELEFTEVVIEIEENSINISEKETESETSEINEDVITEKKDETKLTDEQIRIIEEAKKSVTNPPSEEEFNKDHIGVYTITYKSFKEEINNNRLYYLIHDYKTDDYVLGYKIKNDYNELNYENTISIFYFNPTLKEYSFNERNSTKEDNWSEIKSYNSIDDIEDKYKNILLIPNYDIIKNYEIGDWKINNFDNNKNYEFHNFVIKNDNLTTAKIEIQNGKVFNYEYTYPGEYILTIRKGFEKNLDEEQLTIINNAFSLSKKESDFSRLTKDFKDKINNSDYEFTLKINKDLYKYIYNSEYNSCIINCDTAQEKSIFIDLNKKMYSIDNNPSMVKEEWGDLIKFEKFEELPKDYKYVENILNLEFLDYLDNNTWIKQNNYQFEKIDYTYGKICKDKAYFGNFDYKYDNENSFNSPTLKIRIETKGNKDYVKIHFNNFKSGENCSSQNDVIEAINSFK